MQAKTEVANSMFVCCKSAAAEKSCSDQIAGAIASLGHVASVYPGCWYLETPLDISELKFKLTPNLSETATLVVVDATNHQVAWRNITPDGAELIRETWSHGSLPADLQRVAAKRNSRSAGNRR